MTGIVDSVTSLFQSVGRYFSIVSLIPGVFLILNVLFLVGITQGGQVSLGDGFDPIKDLDVGGWLAVAAGAAGIGLLLHPLQYALTQLFEGYWGPGTLALKFATARVLVHRKHAARFDAEAALARRDWVAKAHRSRPAWLREQLRGSQFADLRAQLALERLHSPDLDFLIPTYASAQANLKALGRFPENHGRIMPTRLGNTLRRHEDRIGSVYGLDVVAIAPLITQVAREKDVGRVSDEGEQMDLSLRLSLVFMATTAVYAVWLAPYGPWAALALVPYGCAYVAYRGACIAAENYMSAVAALVHLNRFSLYEALHLSRPGDLEQERATAEHVTDMVNESSPQATWRYE